MDLEMNEFEELENRADEKFQLRQDNLKLKQERDQLKQDLRNAEKELDDARFDLDNMRRKFLWLCAAIAVLVIAIVGVIWYLFPSRPQDTAATYPPPACQPDQGEPGNRPSQTPRGQCSQMEC